MNHHPPLSNRKELRVLAVDDEAPTLQATRAILECSGFVTTTVHSIEKACALLDANAPNKFDLVLTDLFFGDVPRGYEVAAAARERRPAIPVVLLTGRPSFGGACEALRNQVAEILVKPVEPQRLIDACSSVVLASEIERRALALEARDRVLARVVPRMVEAKDSTTSGHSERVIRYVDRLAEKCGIEDHEREQLKLAALLHDVGKIGIPSSILRKPGPLTADERTVIQRHPEIGRDILADLEDSEAVQRWVYQHHERWDGRGYPNGLRGEEVDLPGRILVLAEVFDALAEKRSYKPAWSVEKIVGFFEDQAGKHFDPELAHIVADGLKTSGRAFFSDANDQLF